MPRRYEDRQQGIQAARPPGPARQDGRREPDVLGLIGAAVAQPDPLNGNGTDAGLPLALRPMAVANHAVPSVRQLHALHGGEKRVRFGLDGLCQEPAGAAPQNRRQRIVDRVGLTEGYNGAPARHGVSVPSGVQAGFHPSRYAASLKPSSPSFGHSSLPPLDHHTRNLQARSASPHPGTKHLGVVQQTGKVDQVGCSHERQSSSKEIARPIIPPLSSHPKPPEPPATALHVNTLEPDKSLCLLTFRRST